MVSRRPLHFLLAPVSLALSIGITALSPNTLIAFADTPVNQTIDTTEVNSGTYYNTDGGKTTFNATGSGLYVAPSTIVTGLEVEGVKNADNVHTLTPTGNGGWLLFNAPGQVVRIDGQISVDALKNGNGAYIGNGGRVSVNSAYLYQNGQIYANGLKGGHVELNVGSMTMGPAGRIYAKSYGNDGGQVTITATGAVDIERGAVIDASGKMIGRYDPGLITIKVA